MNRREIAMAVRQTIVGHFGCHPARVNNDDAELGALAPGGQDGLPLLFAQLKAKFQISISGAEAAFCQTVGTTIDLVENKLEARPSGGLPQAASSGCRGDRFDRRGVIASTPVPRTGGSR